MQRLLLLVLTALIAVPVALSSYGVQRTSRQTAVASLQYEMANERVDTSGEMITRDFRNLGSGVVNRADIFPAAPIDTTSCRSDRKGGRCYFAFQARVDSTSQVPQRVRYEWTRTKTIVLNTKQGTTHVPAYTLVRYVDGTANTLRLEGLTEFEIQLYNADGARFEGHPAQAHKIRVALAVAAKSGPADGPYDYQRRWENNFRPRNLMHL